MIHPQDEESMGEYSFRYEYGRDGDVMQQDNRKKTAMSSSFADIKRKTMRDLYHGQEGNGYRSGSGNDKSPKGSVDEPIRPLIDFLNKHPHYATTSSCSGRIVLFESSSSSSNKGGRWLLSRHDDQVTVNHVREALLSSVSSPSLELEVDDGRWSSWFRMEPMLLHVRCHSWRSARRLLAAAFACGLRESGMVVGGGKLSKGAIEDDDDHEDEDDGTLSGKDLSFTVAVRSQALAMAVPLSVKMAKASSSGCQWYEDYLKALVEEANERQRRNLAKTDRFLAYLREGALPLPKIPSPSTFPSLTPSSTLSSLPSLRLEELQPSLPLYDHAAVVVHQNEEHGQSVEVVVVALGGVLMSTNALSDRMYLRRTSLLTTTKNIQEIKSDDEWRSVPIQGFSPRRGHAACVLNRDRIVVYGGRGRSFGNTAPLTTTSLVVGSVGGHFKSPTRVSGTLPPGLRWGHTLTAISDNTAVLVGGRDARAALPGTVYTLTRTSAGNNDNDDDDDECYVWATLNDLDLPPRFHHSAVSVFSNCLSSSSSFPNTSTTMNADADILFLFGGWTDVGDLLGSNRNQNGDDDAPSVRVDLSSLSVRTFDVPMPGLLPWSKVCGLEAQVVVACGVDDEEGQGTLAYRIHDDDDALYALPLVCPSTKTLTTHARMRPAAVAVSPTEAWILGGVTERLGLPPIPAGPDHRVVAATHRSTVAIPPIHLPNKERGNNDNDKDHHDDNHNDSAVTHVLYVDCGHAKTLKVALEAEGLLNKTYRLTAAAVTTMTVHNEEDNHVADVLMAVPVHARALEIVTTTSSSSPAPEWYHMVRGSGQQRVRYSAAVLAKRRRR